MTSDDTTSHDSTGAGALTDISVPRRTGGDVIVILIIAGPAMIGVAALVIAVSSAYSRLTSSADVGWILGIATLVTALSCMFAVRKKLARDAAKTCLNRSSDDPYAIVVERHLKDQWGLAVHAPIVIRELAARGAAGLTMRSCDEGERVSLKPLDVTIEPIAVDESAPAFASLRDTLDTAKETSGGSGRSESAADADWQRGFKRNLRHSGGWFAIVGLVMMCSILLYDFTTKGAVDLTTVAIAVLCGSSLIGFGGRGAWRQQNQWLLVPGGLITRKPARKSQDKWHPHLFDRRDSVLLVRQERRHLWCAWVADARHENSAQMTSAEAEMLLRAWLSPLEPPPVEQLSDLE